METIKENKKTEIDWVRIIIIIVLIILMLIFIIFKVSNLNDKKKIIDEQECEKRGFIYDKTYQEGTKEYIFCFDDTGRKVRITKLVGEYEVDFLT